MLKEISKQKRQEIINCLNRIENIQDLKTLFGHIYESMFPVRENVTVGVLSRMITIIYIQGKSKKIFGDLDIIPFLEVDMLKTYENSLEKAKFYSNVVSISSRRP